jgi:hypothetical protein
MPHGKPEDDRRQLQRFRVQDGAFVILSPSDAGVGRLIDISMDGLSFDYVTTQEPSSEPTALEILVSDSAFRLYNVPCKIISDFETFQIPEARSHKRRCGLQFGELTQSQISQLEYFIQHYTIREVVQDLAAN